MCALSSRGVLPCVMLLVWIGTAASATIDFDTTLDASYRSTATEIRDGALGPIAVTLDGGYVGSATVRGASVLDVRTGGYDTLDAYDSSTVNLLSGRQLGDAVTSNDRSIVNVFSGEFEHGFSTSGEGTTNVYGGTFERGFFVTEMGTLNIFGQGLQTEYLSFDDSIKTTSLRVIGVLRDGHEISENVGVGENASLVLHNVPEPIIGCGYCISSFVLMLSRVRREWR